MTPEIEIVTPDSRTRIIQMLGEIDAFCKKQEIKIRDLEEDIRMYEKEVSSLKAQIKEQDETIDRRISDEVLHLHDKYERELLEKDQEIRRLKGQFE